MLQYEAYTRNDLIFECTNFIKYKREDLERFNFTEETIEYLVNIGLPGKNNKDLGSDWIPYEVSDFKICEDYILIGQFGRTLKVGIKEDTQGVYNVSFRKNGDLYDITQFNSSIEKWVLSTKTYENYAKEDVASNENSEEDIKNLGRELRKALEKIDMDAMLDKNSGWRLATLVFEECIQCD